MHGTGRHPTALAAVLCLALPFILAACGGGGGAAPKPQPTPEAQAQSDAVHATLNRIIGNVDIYLHDYNPNGDAGSIYRNSISDRLFRPSPDPTNYDKDGVYEGLPARWEVAIARQIIEGLRVQQYFGYMEHSYFSTLWLMNNNVSGGVSNYSAGKSSLSNPIEGAEWRGVMFGAYNILAEGRNDIGNILTGDARITFQPEPSSLDVAFENIVDTVSGAKHDPLYWREIGVHGGGEFYHEEGAMLEGQHIGRYIPADDRNVLMGRFYGPAHEEVGGVFYRGHMEGSFGGKRQ